jgi:hypothetical protein
VTIPPEDTHYHFFVDEEFEDADTVIAGETEPDEDDDGAAPVRLLQGFAVYDSDTLEMVDVLDIPMYPERDFRASGLVVPWLGDADDIFIDLDEDQENGIAPRLALSRILELNIHHQEDEEGPFDPWVAKSIPRAISLYQSYLLARSIYALNMLGTSWTYPPLNIIQNTRNFGCIIGSYTLS